MMWIDGTYWPRNLCLLENNVMGSYNITRKCAEVLNLTPHPKNITNSAAFPQCHRHHSVLEF